MNQALCVCLTPTTIDVATSQDFLLEGVNYKSQHAITSLEIFERGTFCGTEILLIGRSVAVAYVWHITRIFLQGESLKPPQKCKGGNWETYEQTSVTQTYHRRGFGGGTPPLGDFLEKSHFNAIGSHFACV